jgi:tetratricopeptide (TPR) repeat protein
MDLVGIQNAEHEADYLIRRAQENAMVGDHSQAIDLLKKAIDKYPRYAEAYVLLGNCQDCLGKSEDALTSYDRALQIDAGHAEAWFNKGMILKKMGQTGEATKCIEKSIDLYCGR